MLCVNTYAYAITQQTLPVLNYPPANYANFTMQFVPAKAHCQEWSGGIFPQMISLPSMVVNQSAPLFKYQDNMSEQLLTILINDPTNASARTQLATILLNMQNNVKNLLTIGNTLVSSLDTFNTNIQADLSVLNTIASEALADVGVDQQQIEELNATIRQLNADISAAQKWLVVSEIGIVASIFVGLIGAVVCTIPGAQGYGAGIIVVAVVGEAASITGTVIASKKITADQAMITTQQQQIAGTQQDVILLQGINTQFQQLALQNQAAQKALVTITKMWENLNNTFQAVINDLNNADIELNTGDYSQLQTDLIAAESDWAVVIDFATALAGISYQWQGSDGTLNDYSENPPNIDGSKVTPIVPTP